MANRKIATVAVSAATYAIDKGYDYLVPEELSEHSVSERIHMQWQVTSRQGSEW